MAVAMPPLDPIAAIVAAVLFSASTIGLLRPTLVQQGCWSSLALGQLTSRCSSTETARWALGMDRGKFRKEVGLWDLLL